MQTSAVGMHYNTPRLFAVDPRGLPVRSVDYWREVEGAPAQARINRTLHNAAGVAVKQWDPRLWRLQQQDPMTPANLTTVHSLTGHPVCTVSVDAGSQISLLGQANEVLQGWDSRGTRREIRYDDRLRPVAVFEHVATQPSQCAERMEYGGADPANRDRNQCGQLIRQDSPGGTVLFEAFAITGQCTRHIQHFTLDAVAPDWLEPIADRQELLEPGESAVSTWRYGPQGNVLETVDARQNCQAFAFTLDGRLHQSALKLAGKTTWQTLVSEIEYNADGQTLKEVAGNGVRTTLTYDPEDGRLMERLADSDRAGLLQHLFYTYDRMGNVLSIEDKALPVRYFNNQRIDPVSRFIYDSLYQLIQAFGWEAGGPNQGPESVGRTDPAAVSNYQQHYHYDEGGNLLKLIHVGAQTPGRELTAARYSNRCLPWRNGVPPTEADIAAAFDANGNLLELDQGRLLTWDLRNQLHSVCPVERDSGRNDCEHYLYDGAGLRVRKIRSLQTNARTVVAEVRYLKGLELRTNSSTGQVLQVITAQAGLNTVRVLHWESAPPSGVNDQYRYTLVDHLNSCTVELTDDAQSISREVFYAFGETAWFAGADVIDVDYKTIRYSGKERDATGLYYYDFRYYVPWLFRWLNPDPARDVDGVNLYRMVRNNPITFFDEQGKESKSKTSLDSAGAIFESYKDGYSETDRNLPFQMMADITDNKLKFKTTKASPGVLEKTKTRRFTLRHYTVSGTQGDAPPFTEISSNFSLVHKQVKTLGGKGGNTNEKDWTKAGNSAFTFFLLAIDGEVNERKFLGGMTHYADYDLEDDEAMKAALGADFEKVEFFASPDVLDPKHSSDLSKVPMVKGRLKDLKALLLGNSEISPVQVGRMDSKALLNQIDNAFGGSLEIKIPGSIKVKTWHRKTTMPAIGKKAA
ncbi:RHS repeat domain-containing protein [Pseudomonas sp. NPDC099000]|uniref:RHS repeat domain-containing protein n=1 Tax=Pseudomonas sp. NPDC099000 TaxID=3364488 RepID=UPI00383B556A